jgi:multidrug efflux pump subunit AcrA (membrane-fusion protein)
MFARLNVVTARREGVLVVPRGAVDGGTVFVIDPLNIVHRVPLTVGLANQQLIEIQSGIAEGDTIVTTSAIMLVDGDGVTIT